MGANERADIGRRLHAPFRCTPDHLESITWAQTDGDPIARGDVLPFQLRLAGEPLGIAIEEEADRTQCELTFRESGVSSD